MARRPGEEGGFRLSLRDRRVVGWIVAAAVVIGVAVVVGLLGGNGDGTPVAPAASASPSGAVGEEITFGTALDSTTGEVAADARTTRFAAGDTFAYSIPPRGPLPGTVYVEVERIGGGPVEVVQPAAEDGMQTVPEGSPAVAFTVPAGRLLEVFGPGEYRMRIYADPTGAPLAGGTFVLVGTEPAGTAGPSETAP
jgi:hypothetical protein